MSAKQPLGRLPYVLLAAMTVASFGGPFAILVIVQGGKSARWPPDRPVEWIVIALVLGLVIGLFLACVSIGWWYRRLLLLRAGSSDTIPSPPVRMGREIE